MNSDKDTIKKAQDMGGWPDWGDYDLEKSNNSIDLMKGVTPDGLEKAKKDTSKLVPVQKQVSRNGKTFQQTVWVSPDDAKKEQGNKNKAPKEEKKKESKGKSNLTPNQQEAKQAFDAAWKDENFQKVLESYDKPYFQVAMGVMNQVDSGKASSIDEAVEQLIGDEKFMNTIEESERDEMEMELEESQDGGFGDFMGTLQETLQLDYIGEIEEIEEENDLSEDEMTTVEAHFDTLIRAAKDFM